MIQLDRSTTSILVTCTDCPHWYVFSFTLDHAYSAAAHHEHRCHGITNGQARSRLDNFRYRQRGKHS